MPEDMPDRMPEDMPDRMPEDMSDRMPEDLPVTKCINVMVGITRSKVIYFDTLLVLWTSYLHGGLGALRSSQWICRATNSSQMEPGASRWRSDLSPTEIVTSSLESHCNSCFASRCITAESKLL